MQLAADEQDADTADAVVKDLERYEKELAAMEFRRMFSGKMDPNGAFLDIQSGSGGTEAQDWASMLLRMYLRWGEAHGYKTEIIEESSGEVAKVLTICSSCARSRPNS